MLGAGGINKVYRRIATDPELNAKYNITVMSRDPWIVTLDNFITDEESAALIKTLDGKFERSSSVGKKVDAGTPRCDATVFESCFPQPRAPFCPIAMPTGGVASSALGFHRKPRTR